MANPAWCGMQDNVDPNQPSAVMQIVIAESAIVAVMAAPEIPVALAKALSLKPRGLPPSGVRPPVRNPESCKVGPSTRDPGQSSIWDENGGEWRYAPENVGHNPHWDYNPWESWNMPWRNVPIDNLPPVK
jgi:hypothetical protein